MLGFSAGIPILLIFSSLSLWLREAGVSKSSVTFFSWAALGYSFKFIWAPLIDKLPVPVLSKLMGRRRGWLLVAQCAVISAICLMAVTDPQQGLVAMALAAVLLGFSSATQDVVIDAFRIESANARMQAILGSTYLAGYRIAMIVAGAGALYLAEYFGSTSTNYSYIAWRNTYFCMALFMLVGVATTLCIKEPTRAESNDYPYATRDYARFLAVFILSLAILIAIFLVTPSAPDVFSGGTQTIFTFLFNAGIFCLALASAIMSAMLCTKLQLVNRQMVEQGYVEPIKDFFKRYGKLAIWVLLLVGFYRISDIVLGIIANVFYQDMGYSKIDIANVTKVFGVLMTIVGSFLGGVLALRVGVMRALMLGAILVVVTNLLFVWLTAIGNQFTYFDIPLPSFSFSAGVEFTGWTFLSLPKELTLVIIMDNLTQGIALIAFIAWLSSLTNVSFTATQYAIFSSVMTLFPKLFGGYSGTIVEAYGYSNFFIFASALGIPIIGLIYFLSSRLEFEQAARTR
ncbi:PAT family beta-lactamase induction signal transducer AmpG [Arenicella xantha]|uniref:PAT family beta-lactamase induction signal transducer AmpG n=2 Tax=Arenicella xantha TaxID=644221 RepID=A0A395JFN4_9GAMM|nr:PAT family beta-lactamase induction signal transducer AmpG [Arenicella xantha]